MIKIGFITATFNRPDQLAALHESLAWQNDTKEWCHYIIDDGSTSDYSKVFEALRGLSGNLHTKKISNSGVLIARNHGIEMALADECTHLCFIDDDDILLPNGIAKIAENIQRFKEQVWFMFPSEKPAALLTVWPDKPIEMSWFDDIVLKGLLGSDNQVVLAANFVGNVRFSTRGRNQREWTFFLELCRKNDRILVLPDVLQKITYLADGLTAQTQKLRYKPEQIFNSVERAVHYWLLRPTKPRLLFQMIKQVGTAPIKLILHCIYRSRSE